MTEKFFYESKEIKVHLEAARGQFKAGSTIVDSGGRAGGVSAQAGRCGTRTAT